MSSYLKKEHAPFIFIPTVYEFALALEKFSCINRNINIPSIPTEEYIYSKTLFNYLIRCLAVIPGSLILESPVVFSETDLTKLVLGLMVNNSDLEWELDNVSLINVQKKVELVIMQKVELDRLLMDEYTHFLIKEKIFLKSVEKHFKYLKFQTVIIQKDINPEIDDTIQKEFVQGTVINKIEEDIDHWDI